MAIKLEIDHPAETIFIATKAGKAVRLNLKRDVISFIITSQANIQLNSIDPIQSEMFHAIWKTPARPSSVKCCAIRKRKLIPGPKMC